MLVNTIVPFHDHFLLVFKLFPIKTSIAEQGFEVYSTKKKIVSNRYEPKGALEDKVYLETYYNHQPGSVEVDETLQKIKTQELQIVGWT